MTTSVDTLLATYSATDAGFRIWAKAWHDTIDALGCTQVWSNIDFTTVTMPTVAQTAAGSRVYELNDSVSGSSPLYFKLTWGRGSTASSDFGFRIDLSFGTSHDGSGTVGGYGFSCFVTCQQASPADGGLLGCRTETGIVLFTNVAYSTTVQQVIILERMANSGAATSDGYAVLYGGVAADTTTTFVNNYTTRLVNTAGGVVFAKQIINGWVYPSCTATGTSLSYLSKAPVGVLWTFGGYDPLTNVILTTYEQRANNTSLTATVNGHTGTYRTPNGGANGWPINNGIAFKVA